MVFRIDSGAIAASHTTEDGWQRVYLRLARADHDYRYFSADGSQRIERCSADELFNKDSAATAKMMPLGIGHPASIRVNSDNVTGWMTGSTGHSVIRENTADGEFLGITATIFDRKTQDRLRETPGISPGYSTQLRGDAQDPYFDQTKRRYNHGAVAVIPRGGEAVKAMFEGLRFDSLEDSDLWIAQADPDIYRADVDEDFILPILERSDMVPGLAEKKPVDLDMVKMADKKKGKKKTCDKCKGETCECSDRKAGKPQAEGFGDYIQQRKIKTNRRMDTVSLKIGEITYPEVPVNLASAVSPLIEAAGRADSLGSEFDQYKVDAAAQIQELEEEIEELENKDEGDRVDESQALQIAKAVAKTVDSMRTDGKMLVDMGLLSSFNVDFDFIVDNMQALQGEMIAVASPAMANRIDSFDEGQTALAYETALSSLKASYEQQQRRADSEQQQPTEYREDMYTGGSYKRPMVQTKDMTLTQIGKTAMPVSAKNNASKMLRKFIKADDEIFENAGKGIQHSLTTPTMSLI